MTHQILVRFENFKSVLGRRLVAKESHTAHQMKVYAVLISYEV